MLWYCEVGLDLYRGDQEDMPLKAAEEPPLLWRIKASETVFALDRPSG